MSDRKQIRTDPEVLEHSLNRHFPELLQFESTEAAEASPVYREIRERVEEIMESIVREDFAEEAPQARESVSAAAWNIERGRMFEGILKALSENSTLKDRDVYLLTELDYGMARSDNRFVARELAKQLKLNYAFAPVYIALQKGSGIESEFDGENENSIHGLAVFSRYPIKNVQAVNLPNGKDKMIGKEKRLGYLRALIADIDHPAGEIRAVTVHLDVHCSRIHRQKQVRLIVEHLETLDPKPTIIGGDFNTTTYNAQNATRAILGFWRRVMMGVHNVAKNHYPHPDRYFEKGLFGEFEKRGFEYKPFNNAGIGTLHYNMENVAYNTNLGDWVPKWCFPFIFWASRRVGGTFSLRLDWFAGKNIELAEGTGPKVIGDLKDEEGTPLSDHDAIALEFVPRP
ncbi:MAG: endonuclease/exonuclease/phosphatase family protein [Acidobacteriota bacterium]|nr:endonuclease/exonuclease/phosphatase family protein [Acidobacteriota bacterium]